MKCIEEGPSLLSLTLLTRTHLCAMACMVRAKHCVQQADAGLFVADPTQPGISNSKQEGAFCHAAGVYEPLGTLGGRGHCQRSANMAGASTAQQAL